MVGRRVIAKRVSGIGVRCLMEGDGNEDRHYPRGRQIQGQVALLDRLDGDCE